MTETKKMGRPSNGKPCMVAIPVTEEVKKKLSEEAKARRRSIASFAGGIIEEALGTSKPETPAPQAETATPESQKASGHLNEGATALLTISLQPKLKAAVKAIAKVERRTASNMACLMIHDWIEEWEAKHPGVSIWPDEEEAES